MEYAVRDPEGSEVGNPQAVFIKARSILKQAGHNDGEMYREYRDWHIEIHGSSSFVSVWTSTGMVFMALARLPIYYRPGPWEQYLDRLFQRISTTRRSVVPDRSIDLLALSPVPPESSGDN